MQVESLTLEGEWFLMEVTGLHPEYDPHFVAFAPGAVENRRDVYGTDLTAEQAIAAIVREHAVRLNDDIKHRPEHDLDHGGLHPDVEVTFSPTASAVIKRATITA